VCLAHALRVVPGRCVRHADGPHDTTERGDRTRLALQPDADEICFIVDDTVFVTHGSTVGRSDATLEQPLGCCANDVCTLEPPVTHHGVAPASAGEQTLDSASRLM
jgi:hypothetical protein